MNREIRPKGRYGVFVPYALLLCDVIVINAVFLFATSLHGLTTMWHFKTMLVLINAAFLPVIKLSLPLRRQRSIPMERLVVRALEMVIVHAVILFALVAFLDIDNVPWSFYAEFYSGLIILLPLSWIVMRLVVKSVRRHGRNYVNVVIIGTSQAARRIASELQQDSGYGYNIHGFFDTGEERPQNFSIGKYLGSLDMLEDYVKSNGIHEIYYAIPGNHEDILARVLKIADDQMATFYYVPQLSRMVARSFHLTHVGTTPVLLAHNNPLDNPINRGVKRVFDILFSSAFLVVSPVIFIPVAIAIKISSPGPIFFKQKRTGYRGEEFTCWKFRTMRVNADADRAQASADDPRKTRLGNFLRHSSIDELPQFWNVLRGDMSVVGPRPHMIKHTEDYSRLIDSYMLRHVVKPGITGWAQVRGFRGATNELWMMVKRVENDVWYIENWSLLLDIKIIVRTVTNALAGEENAY